VLRGLAVSRDALTVDRAVCAPWAPIS